MLPRNLRQCLPDLARADRTRRIVGGLISTIPTVRGIDFAPDVIKLRLPAIFFIQ